MPPLKKHMKKIHKSYSRCQHCQNQINKYNKKSTINMNTSQISYNDIISIIQNNIKESLFVLSSNDDLINKLLKNKSYYLINNYITFIFDEIG